MTVLETLTKTAKQAAKIERVAHLTLRGCESDYYAQHKKGGMFDPHSVLQHHRLNEPS